MAVRPDVPWQWRIARAGVVIAVIAAAITWAYTTGSLRDRDVEQTLAQLRVQSEQQQTDLADLRAKLAQSDRQLQMERAAAVDLARQVKQLASDHAAVKEDLAFFQSLAKTGQTREAGVSVNRLRVQPTGTAGEYRYQLVLVQNGQRKEFRGHLEFLLEVQHEGRRLTMLVPPESSPQVADYEVDFKLFQRVDGAFKVAPGAEVKTMQLRLYENGSRAPKLTQTVSVF